MRTEITAVVYQIDTEEGKPCADLYLGVPVSGSSPTAALKSGILSPSDFTGTPRLATVSFSSDFQDENYVILIAGVDARIFTYQTKTASGFVINSNANGALTGEVSWFATSTGES